MGPIKGDDWSLVVKAKEGETSEIDMFHVAF